MLRNLFEDLRIRYAVWRYGITKTQLRNLAHVNRAIEIFQGLGDDVDIQARLRHAALLEAHHVPDSYFQLMLSIYRSRRLLADDLKIFTDEGIKTPKPGPHQRVRDAAQIHRLQNAVKRLAFIAGPGFTTQQLIDDGLIKEGDL